MSYEATLYFKSGRAHDRRAPRSVGLEGEFVFGRGFPSLIHLMDQSARELGVTEPGRFVWHDPMQDEGELDQLSAEEFEALERKHNATVFWVPVGEGIRTFAARHKPRPEFGTPTHREYALAFEVACFHAALQGAATEGEEAFHIRCY